MNFRSHVAISTEEFPIHAMSSILDLMAQSKIDDLHVSRVVKDNVFKLQVAMSNFLLMTMFQSTKKLLKIISTNLFWETLALGHYLEQIDLAHFNYNSVDFPG